MEQEFTSKISYPIIYTATLVSGNHSQVPLASVTFSESVFPSVPPPTTAWYLGSFRKRAHNVQGKMYALDEKTILLTGFYFDGNAPGNFILS